MNLDLLFNIANLVVMPFWLIMIALPRWPWAVRVIRSPWIAAPTAALYAVALFSPSQGSAGGFDINGFTTLTGVMGLLSNPQGAAAGWAHFLTFDLLVGRYMYLDALEPRIHPALMIVPLFFTLMLGPIGFLMYLVLRTIMRRRRAMAA
jgi:hypothetical protein